MQNLEFRRGLWYQQSRVLGVIWRYLRDSTFSHFGTVPACDGQTDTRRRHIPR